MKRVVAVEIRVNDKPNLLVVRKDMEESQPDCLEQYQLDILKKSQPNCLMQSQPDCLEQSQSDCLEQTVERKIGGEMTMECMRCEYTTKGYKRGRLKKRLENHLLRCPAIIEVEEEPENLVPEPVHAPKSVPPHDTHADSVDNDEVSKVGCEANKFITSSGTGPLYKYLRYKIPTTVGVMTEVDVFDTGGTMKTVDNLDVSSKHDDPNKPDVLSNQDVTSGTMSRSHASTMSRSARRKMLMNNVQHLTLLYDGTRLAGIYKVDGRDTFDNPVKTTVTGVTRQYNGDCGPDPKEESENPVQEPVHVPESVPPHGTPVVTVTCKRYRDEVGDDAYVGQDGHGEAGVRQVRSGGVHTDNRDRGGGVKFRVPNIGEVKMPPDLPAQSHLPLHKVQGEDRGPGFMRMGLTGFLQMENMITMGRQTRRSALAM
jgi:hypothetical protein